VLSEKVLKIAYTLPQGVESEVQDEGSGEYFIVKVDKIARPQPPSVQDFHAELSQMYIRQETLTRMAAKAEDVLAKTKKGMSFDAAAASVGGQLLHVSGANRADANIYKSLGPKLAERMFAAKSGEVFAGANDQGLVMVAKIDAIQPSPPAEAARMAGSYRAPVSKQIFQEGYRISQQVARDKVKPKTDLARARLAIGATAADAPPDPTAAKGGKLAQ
jgi:peptidyl-prolyl cis-trans isomerase D